MDLRKLLACCEADLPRSMKCLKAAVEIESPTYSPQDIARLAHFFAREFKRHHGEVRLLDHPVTGPAVVAEFWGKTKMSRTRKAVSAGAKSGATKAEKTLLLIGHLDTVWAKGTLASMPFRICNGKAYGPGIFDMKAGIIQGLAAIHALQSAGFVPSSPVRFFLNSDEEVGSRAFRKELEAEAKRARAVMVLEPSANGALKTARKGGGEFRIAVHGRLAHAGINPQDGVNAIAELARQIVRVEQLAQPARGLTINTGVIEGGTRTNVIPEFARATVDVRIPRLQDREMIERKVFGLKPVNPQARLKIEGGLNRPPMERKVAAELFRKAKRAARELGFDIQEASTGGGSDGNFCAALGVPTLDGLGGVGAGAHAHDEHIIIREVPRRAALLAALLATL